MIAHRVSVLTAACSLFLLGASALRAAEDAPAPPGLQVGTAAIEIEADDSMIIAGGIGPGKASGQEGALRATAVVLRDRHGTTLAIATLDILMITRSELDPVLEAVEKETGIPRSHILVNCTHTHHAPSTLTVHGYRGDPTFTARVRESLRQALIDAHARLEAEPCTFHFHLGREETVGQNSRQLLPDGSIYWIGPRDQFVRPTGPFDPELPVLAFRGPDQSLRALLFNHSTHTIGTLRPGVRSPSFYGLAAQELEERLGGVVLFLEGASGSTHNLELPCDVMKRRIMGAALDALEKSEARPVERVASLKRPFRFRVRDFDEEQEDAAVSRYCRTWTGANAEEVISVFRRMREALHPQRGEERDTWIQALLIGDVAIVGVPAEFFTKLGIDIKNRSPFRYTYVAELANDWIGYLPDLDAHRLGGYQVWTGFHSYAEPGTGERLADAAVELLKELAAQQRE